MNNVYLLKLTGIQFNKDIRIYQKEMKAQRECYRLNKLEKINLCENGIQYEVVELKMV